MIYHLFIKSFSSIAMYHNIAFCYSLFVRIGGDYLSLFIDYFVSYYCVFFLLLILIDSCFSYYCLSFISVAFMYDHHFNSFYFSVLFTTTVVSAVRICPSLSFLFFIITISALSSHVLFRTR